MTSEFSRFRIVEAFSPENYTDTRDGQYHLVSERREMKTLCYKNVANLTLIHLRDFGRPADDAEWCLACVAKLARIEAKVPADPDLRKGYTRIAPEAAGELALLVAGGMSQKEASRRLGISQTAACKMLKRRRETQINTEVANAQ